MTEAKIAFILINFIARDIHEDASHKHTVELQWYEHRWLIYHGLFELIFESLRNFSDSSRKQILREILFFYNDIVYCVYSLELPRQF